MNALPFSRLTLSFHNSSLEEKYDNFLSEQKLTYFRILMSITVLNTLVGLFRSLIQQWDIFLILSLAVQTALYFLSLILSRRISPYLKYILPLLYVAQYTYFIIGALNDLLEPHYVYGFIGGIFSSCMLNYLSIKTKVLILSSSVWIMLGIFEIYSLINLNYIFLAVGATDLQACQAYFYEYNSRLNFSQGIIINQQHNLMYKYTKQKILILSFNKNKTFFELDFVNQQFEQHYKIDNNQDNLKEFLRNHFIINLANHQLFGSLKVQKFANKQITLEDLLYEKYRAQKNQEEQKQDEEYEQDFTQFEMIDSNNVSKEILVQIIYGLKMYFLLIQMIIIKRFKQRNMKKKQRLLIIYQSTFQFKQDQIYKKFLNQFVIWKFPIIRIQLLKILRESFNTFLMKLKNNQYFFLKIKFLSYNKKQIIVIYPHFQLPQNHIFQINASNNKFSLFYQQTMMMFKCQLIPNNLLKYQQISLILF